MGHIGNEAHGYNLGHMGNGKHGQRDIMVNTLDRDGAPGGWGTWVMGHMGSGHMWTCAGSCVTSLILYGT